MHGGRAGRGGCRPATCRELFTVLSFPAISSLATRSLRYKAAWSPALLRADTCEASLARALASYLKAFTYTFDGPAFVATPRRTLTCNRAEGARDHSHKTFDRVPFLARCFSACFSSGYVQHGFFPLFVGHSAPPPVRQAGKQLATA